MKALFGDNDSKLIALSFLIVLILAMCVYVVFFYPKEPVFCTVNDGVYQAFQQNIDTFKNFFPAVSLPGTIEATTFNVPGQRQYVVRADYFSAPDEKSPMLYVPVLEMYSSLTSGIEGYLYSSNLSDYWKTNYKLTKLSENFYCYHN